MGPGAGRSRLHSRTAPPEHTGSRGTSVLHSAKASRPASAQHLGFVEGAGCGTGSLASGGTLGGSQAGGRLTYAIDRRIAASLRSSAPIGGSRGGEVAAGVRLTPFPSIPVSVTAERRQAIGKFSTGRSAFAFFAEGGVYQQPLGWDLFLDGYGHALSGAVFRLASVSGAYTSPVSIASTPALGSRCACARM